MRFEDLFGACPPDSTDDVVTMRAHSKWRDRKMVWIKAQLAMRDRAESAIHGLPSELAERAVRDLKPE